jgi:uncharacterized SAM-binding protein YcdF (DUF218 family)
LTSENEKLYGIFTRRERWGLSRRGWLAAGAVVAGILVFLLLGIYPFLAVTERVDARVLVVEGWVNKYAIRVAVDEFKTGAYDQVITTGGPVSGSESYTNDYNTAASVGAGRLRAAGLPPEVLQMVPSRLMARDRTYASAVALRDWMREHGLAGRKINVLTEAVHARRSRLLFQEAFGQDAQIGVIGVPNPDYDARRWWRYSEGVRDVIGEILAYFYARFLFWPREP